MANYEATVRTNYFSVKNPTALKELIDSIEAEDTVSLFTHELPDGSMQYGFGCYGSLFGIQDSLDAFYEALQELVCENDAILIFEVGYEKLRYVVGCCTVITSTKMQHIDIQQQALELAAKLLNRPNYNTRLDY